MTGRNDPKEVQVNPTLWGYVIEGPYAMTGPKSLGARMRLVGGLVSALMAAGLLFLGTFAGDLADLAFRFGATAFFAILALILLRRGALPCARELRIDRSRGEIIAGFRDPDGSFVLSGSHDFEDVAGVVLLESGLADLPAQIVLQLADRDEALLVAMGEAAALEPLAARLARDLSAVETGFNPVEASRVHHDQPLVLGPRIEIFAAA